MPRHGAERGVGALGRDQRDLAADGDAEPPRQPVADGDVVVAEIGERAGDDMVGDQLAGADIVGADAAHQRAAPPLRCLVAITWPSTSGVALTTPGTCANLGRESRRNRSATRRAP